MDKSQLVSIQAGNEEALSQFYAEYTVRIYRYLFARVKHRELAEDLTSEVLIKILKNLSRLDPGKNINAWVFTIARNVLIDFYRKKNAQPKQGKGLEIELETPETKLTRETLLRDIIKALQTLSDLEREVIELTYFAELKGKEIAKILRKSTGNIRIIRHRSIKKLKKIIENEYREF